MSKSINRIERADVDDFRTAGHATPRVSSLDVYQHIATKSAIYPGQGTALGLIYVALKMNGEAGEVADHVGKAMRDDNLMIGEDIGVETEYYYADKLYAQRRTAIIKEMGDVLWYLSAAANELGVTLSEVALANLEKLCDRGERNQLRGSGDER